MKVAFKVTLFNYDPCSFSPYNTLRKSIPQPNYILCDTGLKYALKKLSTHFLGYLSPQAQ